MSTTYLQRLCLVCVVASVWILCPGESSAGVEELNLNCDYTYRSHRENWPDVPIPVLCQINDDVNPVPDGGYNPVGRPLADLDFADEFVPANWFASVLNVDFTAIPLVTMARTIMVAVRENLRSW